MWYKKKRFVAAVVAVVVIAVGATLKVDLSGLESAIVEATCQIITCVE